MFIIEIPDRSECKTLTHSDRVFHEALADGGKRYHVKNSAFEDYDIVQIDNDTLKSPMPGYADISAFPSYDIYDEYDRESIWLKLFHGKSRLVERHSVSEFTTSAVISELEKEQTTKEEYDAVVEDNTINYFYAVYLLSRCSSFMCSGQCNGYDMVCDFNEGRFDRICKFQVGKA